MRIDPRDLRRHYESISDEELLALDRDELTDVARTVYDEEFVRRGLNEDPEAEGSDEPGYNAAEFLDGGEPEDDTAEGELDIDVGPDPEWLDDAACACAFTLHSANSNVPTAAKARAVLRNAGIPCHLTMTHEEPSSPNAPPQYLLRLMVPGALNLHATSILDRDIFNEEHESDWRGHLEALSDAELRALKPDIFCAGLLDRVARIRKAYELEFARRNLK